MSKITFSADEKAAITPKIQRYLLEKLDIEVGSFDAEFLLDFFAQEIGGYFYNRALYDAQAALQQQLESIQDTIYQLEKPTESRR
ncbi:DUF2164 domain-containing protein [Porticoccaceae bacterium LTM1]|nr:DUF2164 domain-containing protein [Porticoccaceae bacterium LTM1]